MFLNYINNFRGLAILIILASHTISFFNWDGNELTRNCIRGLVSNSSILFVFISGFLFQHLSSKYEYKSFLLRKFRNIISPYLIISIPAIIFCLIAYRHVEIYKSFFEQPLPVQVLKLYASGIALAPTWFIPMMAIFFIISPLLIFIDKRHKTYYFLIPVSMIISYLVHRNMSNSVLPSFIHFFSVYLIGMCASRNKDIVLDYSYKNRVKLLIIFILLYLIEVNYYEVLNKATGYNYLNYLGKLSICFLLSGLLFKYDAFIKNKFNYLANISFGIFFTHGYFLMLFEQLNYHIFKINVPGNLLFVIIYFFVLLSLSTLTVLIIKKITGKYSRFIIGC